MTFEPLESNPKNVDEDVDDNLDEGGDSPASHPWFEAGRLSSPASPPASSPASEATSKASPPPDDSLRQRLTRCLSLEAELANLAALREPAPLEGRTHSAATIAPASIAGDLQELARQSLEASSPEKHQALAAAIALKETTLERQFWHQVPPALSHRRSLAPLIEAMSDRQLQQEAQMQQGAIALLVEQLPQTGLNSREFDLFSHEAQSLLGTLLEIERRQGVIESLLVRDRTLPGAIITFSILYILAAVALIVLFVVFWGHGFVVESVSQQTLPLIGIPWPVFVWSLFGSLAAILARFLYHPFRRLREMTQWMLLRPIQGVVFGGASYFVLDALLSLLTPFESETPLSMTDEAILLLSFGVGFSDRLAMIVFRWMSQTEAQTR
ncbi:MAG: hypothetical protein R6U67_08690 [Sodalinema sp.]|uniref:hypothetical protein n=1 Tax=Sodalinema sp. TaxID=3080550 RepID=UPI001219F4D4|nr:MAG: hypothetical protein EYR95_01250 [Phormidium sp. SL48-SHIP]